MSTPSIRPLFLGLDLSTQQLKAMIVDNASNIVHEVSVHFDRDLPHHGTMNGAIRGPDAGEVTSPVRMWLEAIDLVCERLYDDRIDFGAIVAISGAGQQHGSVYWSNNASKLLAGLNENQRLAEQLSPAAFSFQRAPIWQDSSTTADCNRLENEIGGACVLAERTGSRAYERFTGNQISKMRRLQPEVYKATARISLVSSFIPSLFIGHIAPIEVSDASGMNLMDVLTCKWDHTLLNICGGPTLTDKLGVDPVLGGANLGVVSDWWVKKWGFSPDCIVAPFTGDNPATVVSLSASGDALLSLGTSTTFLLSIPPSIKAPKRFTTSHLLCHPTHFNGKIAMLCYKNGALAREQVRDKFANGNWDVFNQLVEQTQPGCNGTMTFYFPLPEIIPPKVTGEYFFTTNPTNTTAGPPLLDRDVPPSVHPRAVLESQFLSIRSRIAAILPEGSSPLQRLVMSGGSSANPVIRQVAAVSPSLFPTEVRTKLAEQNIFGMDVFVSATKEAAAYGGALLAKYAWWKLSHPDGTFEDMKGGAAMGLQCVAKPQKEISTIYDSLVSVYNDCEEEIVKLWDMKMQESK